MPRPICLISKLIPPSEAVVSNAGNNKPSEFFRLALPDLMQIGNSCTISQKRMEPSDENTQLRRHYNCPNFRMQPAISDLFYILCRT